MRRARAGAALVLALVVACGEGDDGARDGRDAGGRERPAPGLRRGFVTAVQLGSFADTTNAVALRDSLTRGGWTAYIAPATVNDEMRWRVLVQPTAGGDLPRLVQLGLRADGRDAVVVRDTLPSTVAITPASIEIYPVNRGIEGMLRRIRWARSPDGRSLLAVEDPTGLENEPVPNGFAFVSETGPFIMQVDSVWDVAPSPDWQRLAYARSYWVVSTRESPDAITAAQWAELGERAGLSADSARRAAFPSSSMNIAYGIAAPVVVDVSDRTLAADASPSDAERALDFAGGWNVGWTAAGQLLLGGAPTGVRDDAPPARWMVVDTTRWRPIGPPRERVSRAGVEWTEGPLLDISVAFDAAAPRSLAIEGGRVTSREGWIRIMREGAAGDSIAGGRIVGPGAALAATASGRFIAALVPRETRDRFEVPWEFIVYQIVE